MEVTTNNNNDNNLVKYCIHTSLDMKRRLSGLRGRVTRISHQMENLLRFESPTNILVIERLIKLKQEAWMALNYYESELINSLSTINMSTPNNIEIVHFRAKKDNMKKISHLYDNFFLAASRYAPLIRQRSARCHDNLSPSQHKPSTTTHQTSITMTTRQRIRNLILKSAANRKKPRVASFHRSHHHQIQQQLISYPANHSATTGLVSSPLPASTAIYLGFYPLQPFLVGRAVISSAAASIVHPTSSSPPACDW